MQRYLVLRVILIVTLVCTIILAAFPALQVTFARTPHVPRTAPVVGSSLAGDVVASPIAQPSLSATVALSATATAAASATATASPTSSAESSTTPSGSATPSPTATAGAAGSATGTATPAVTTTTTISATDTPSPTGTTTAMDAATPIPDDSATIAADYAQLPLQFEPNRGQADPSVQYQARGPGFTVYLTANEAVLGLFPSTTPLTGTGRLANGRPAPPPFVTVTPAAVLHLSLVGANAQATLAGQEQLPGTVNYFYGTDPTGWLTNLPTYAEVAYQSVYPGIDMLYHGRQNQQEYDFVVQPGADPSRIRLRIGGADAVRLDGKGNLVLKVGAAALIEDEPRVYQVMKGVQVPVGVR
jgi:hypothetical protein